MVVGSSENSLVVVVVPLVLALLVLPLVLVLLELTAMLLRAGCELSSPGGGDDSSVGRAVVRRHEAEEIGHLEGTLDAAVQHGAHPAVRQLREQA